MVTDLGERGILRHENITDAHHTVAPKCGVTYNSTKVCSSSACHLIPLAVNQACVDFPGRLTTGGHLSVLRKLSTGLSLWPRGLHPHGGIGVALSQYLTQQRMKF